jgi:hypothetical protein
MPTASCTLCGRTFLRRDTSTPAFAGWFPDGWVYFPDDGRPKLQPYCPSCKPAAEVCWEAVGTSAGSPWFLYQPEPGGSVRVARFVRNQDTSPEAPSLLQVDSTVTTPEAVRRAMLVPEGPGRLEAIWATLKS